MTKKLGCVLIIEMAKTKDKAFALFTLKKVPTSPEVKALGIKASTRWNYFNEWKTVKLDDKTHATLIKVRDSRRRRGLKHVTLINLIKEIALILEVVEKENEN